MNDQKVKNYSEVFPIFIRTMKPKLSLKMAIEFQVSNAIIYRCGNIYDKWNLSISKL